MTAAEHIRRAQALTRDIEGDLKAIEDAGVIPDSKASAVVAAVAQLATAHAQIAQAIILEAPHRRFLEGTREEQS